MGENEKNEDMEINIMPVGILSMYFDQYLHQSSFTCSSLTLYSESDFWAKNGGKGIKCIAASTFFFF